MAGVGVDTSTPPQRKKGVGSGGGRQKRPSSSLSPEEGELHQHNLSREDVEEKEEVEEKEKKDGEHQEGRVGGGADLANQDYISFHGKAHTSPLPLCGNVSLPLLPKPLSILKTAETRTFLSKLIWLGNGGRRPQYGNPDTKPCWWPQHILPWEEMKKMGGRKCVELSHINYTEILKQCLSAGYEYFGYDPLTYYSSEGLEEYSSLSMGDNSVLMEEEEEVLAIEEEEEDEKQREPVLEIDLDAVENCKADVRNSEQSHDILCK